MTQQSKKIQRNKKLLTWNIQEIQYTMRRWNLRIIGIEESKDSQLKGQVNIFNKMIEENFPNLKKEMVIKEQEAYWTQNNWGQKEKIHKHIKLPTKRNKAGTISHLSLIPLNINGLNSPIKRHKLTDWICKQIKHFAPYKKNTSITKTDTISE